MNIFERLVSVGVKVSEFPERVEDFSEEANEVLIRYARDLQNAIKSGGNLIEGNLRSNKIDSLGGKVVDFLKQPKGIATALILGAVLIIGIRKI